MDKISDKTFSVIIENTLTDYDPDLPERMTPLQKPPSFPGYLRKKQPKQSPPKIRKMFKKAFKGSPNENNDL